MKDDVIITEKGDATGKIDHLMSLLDEAKHRGATHYKMEWSNDPQWAFKWFRLYRIKSDEEIRREKIETLELQLAELKSQT